MKTNHLTATLVIFAAYLATGCAVDTNSDDPTNTGHRAQNKGSANAADVPARGDSQTGEETDDDGEPAVSESEGEEASDAPEGGEVAGGVDPGESEEESDAPEGGEVAGGVDPGESESEEESDAPEGGEVGGGVDAGESEDEEESDAPADDADAVVLR